MKCPNCCAEMKENKCEYCGTQVQTAINPTTQQPINIVINNSNNNTNSSDKRTYPRIKYSQKSRSTAIFLCCLSFIGLGGLHRFYVGKNGSGLAHFFTFGFFLIGTIIDLIALSHKNFTDCNGLILK